MRLASGWSATSLARRASIRPKIGVLMLGAISSKKVWLMKHGSKVTSTPRISNGGSG